MKNLLSRLLTAWRSMLVAWRNWLNPSPLLEKPPLVYVDPNGQGWTRSPDYQDAEAPDDGQNDVWKWEMRFAMWRYVNGYTGAGSYSLRDAGLSPHADIRGRGPLFPLGTDLACACRRLGYVRLAMATGLFDRSHRDDTESVLAGFYDENEAAVRAEAEDQHARNVATHANWNENRGPFTFDTVEQTISMYTLGPVDAHANVPPMRPFVPRAPPALSLAASGGGPRITGR